MQFASADPSVVKSIRQRYLLNEWLRAAAQAANHASRPATFSLEQLADELVDMMGL